MARELTKSGSPADQSNSSRRRVRVWWLVTVLVVSGTALLLDRTFGEHLRRVRASDALRLRIDLLVLQTPPGLGDDEWAAAVRWTDNLHCNSMLAFEVELGDIQQLCSELTPRTEAGADMSTIDWLWDRYAALAPTGRRYNERFHEVMHEYIEHARREGDVNGDYASFRALARALRKTSRKMN